MNCSRCEEFCNVIMIPTDTEAWPVILCAKCYYADRDVLCSMCHKKFNTKKDGYKVNDDGVVFCCSMCVYEFIDEDED